MLELAQPPREYEAGRTRLLTNAQFGSGMGLPELGEDLLQRVQIFGNAAVGAGLATAALGDGNGDVLRVDIQPDEQLFPARELPIPADWFSGPLHIVSGNQTRARGYRTFERVMRCQISKGVVTHTQQLRNVREDKLTKQR